TPGLASFEVAVRETDLRVRAGRDLRGRARESVLRLRGDIERWAASRPEFLSSLAPLPIPVSCPAVVREMLAAGQAFDVGPMAAVAGAIAEGVGRDLLAFSAECIIENGGDLFVKLNRPARIGLFAGETSPFSRRLKVVVDGGGDGLGVAASSGVIGHSLSFGKADLVVAVARNAAMADAAATSICNRVREPDDVARVVASEREQGRLDGLVVILGSRIGLYGAIELAT
ncbi:MAG TPA: UPF0280 family protein, partial [Candidatus Brocadiia bacterium]|nr:UPF0280 family protein [Candidatus Brocadiia bacterium]